MRSSNYSSNRSAPYGKLHQNKYSVELLGILKTNFVTLKVFIKNIQCRFLMAEMLMSNINLPIVMLR